MWSELPFSTSFIYLRSAHRANKAWSECTYIVCIIVIPGVLSSSADSLMCSGLKLWSNFDNCACSIFPVFVLLPPVCSCGRKIKAVRMVPAPPPLPPRPRRAPSPVYIVPVAPHVVANSNVVPVCHCHLQVSGGDERSHPLHAELHLHNGLRSQRTLSLEAQRWSSPPELVPNHRRSYPGP